MDMEQMLRDLGNLLIPYALNVIGAIAILIIGRFVAGIVSRLVRRAMGKANVDETLVMFFGRLSYIFVIIFSVVAALAKFGIQTTSFVAILAAAGFAIGMALQGSLSNFAAGIMIVAFRPFKIGDFIDAAGVGGTVKEIRLFTTIMSTPDNVKVIVPNSNIFGGIIKNFSVYDTRRIDLTVGIGYGSSIDSAMAAARSIMSAEERILGDPEPQVFVTELADSSVNLLIRCWTRRADFWQTKCDMTRVVKETFDAKEIEIPFPQTVVHMAADTKR